MRLPFAKPVTLVKNSGTPTEQRLPVHGTVQPDKGYFPPTTPVEEGDVVEALDPRGGLQRLKVARVKIYSAGTRADHLEVVWGDMALPTGRSGSSRSGSVIQNFHGPVGAVQTGDGSTANVVQTVGDQLSEIAPLLDSILRGATELSAGAQQDLVEQIEDLRAELDSAKAKPSRIKAFLVAMWQVGKDVATVAPKILDLAKLGHPLLPK